MTGRIDVSLFLRGGDLVGSYPSVTGGWGFIRLTYLAMALPRR